MFLIVTCVGWRVCLFASDGSGVLAEHEEDRFGVHRAGDRPGQRFPAQRHHHCLTRLPGRFVCHLPPPFLLQIAGAAALEPRSPPIPVSQYWFILFFFYESTPLMLLWYSLWSKTLRLRSSASLQQLLRSLRVCVCLRLQVVSGQWRLPDR